MRLDGLPVALRQLARYEAAFSALRNDHDVLDLLCFREAQDLGSKVLRPIGPAQAAAGNRASTQMNAFEAR